MQRRQLEIGDIRREALSTQLDSKLITLSVHLICLQQVRRDASRRAGLSASANPCPALLLADTSHAKPLSRRRHRRNRRSKLTEPGATGPQSTKHANLPVVVSPCYKQMVEVFCERVPMSADDKFSKEMNFNLQIFGKMDQSDPTYHRHLTVSVITVMIITRPHRSTVFADAIYCYRRRSLVCLSICRSVSLSRS